MSRAGSRARSTIVKPPNMAAHVVGVPGAAGWPASAAQHHPPLHVEPVAQQGWHHHRPPRWR
jgi:hypothetical protein